MKVFFPSIAVCLAVLSSTNEAHRTGHMFKDSLDDLRGDANERSMEDLDASESIQRNKKSIAAVASAHSYRFVQPPRPAFDTPYDTSDRRILEDEPPSPETLIYYPVMSSDQASFENEIQNKALSKHVPSSRNYAPVFSYKDHKIVPQSQYYAKMYEQPEWNKPDESNDIPESMYNTKTKDEKRAPVKPNSKLSEFEDLTDQLQKARINYLKSTMVKTKLPSYEIYAEKKFNGKQPEDTLREKRYDVDAYPPPLPPYKKGPTPTPRRSQPHIAREIVKTPGMAGHINPMQTGYPAPPSISQSEGPQHYSEEMKIPPATTFKDSDVKLMLDYVKTEKKKIEQFPSFPEREIKKPKYEYKYKLKTKPLETSNLVKDKEMIPSTRDILSRHYDSQDVIVMNKEFLRNSDSRNPQHEHYTDPGHENNSRGSVRIERQIEYSPVKLFQGFESSEFLSQVGNRVPKSISSNNNEKERFTKSVSAFNNINEILFYPTKHLTPPGHQSNPSERAFGTTRSLPRSPPRSPTRSPYAPKLEYQVTPTYKPKPLAYKGGPTTISSYSSYSPTPVPYSSYGAAEYSKTPSPTFSPTPYTYSSEETYQPSTTLSPYYAKSTPYSPKIVDGNIDLVEDRVANPGHGHHAPYTPSYSNSFGLNKNYGHNKPHHGVVPHHIPHIPQSPHSLHAPHSPAIKAIHPVTPVHAVRAHAPVHPVTPHSLPHVARPHGPLLGARPHAPLHPVKPHAPLHGGGPIHPGATRGYSVGVDHGYGTSYQKVSGFDDYGNQFGYEHGVSHTKPYPPPPYH